MTIAKTRTKADDLHDGIVEHKEGGWWAVVLPEEHGWPPLIAEFPTRAEATQAIIKYRRIREEVSK